MGTVAEVVVNQPDVYRLLEPGPLKRLFGALMLALAWGGTHYPWTSWRIIALIAASVALWAGNRTKV